MSDKQLPAYQARWMAGLNSGDVSAADDAFVPDCIIHVTGFPEIRGLEAWKQAAAGFLAAFPDMRFTVDEHFVAGDRAAFRWHATGTHTGPLGPIAATGKRVT